MVKIKYRPEPTAILFHRSKAYVRGIRGPVGSGKSVTCVMELLRMAMEQAPAADGVRYTRFGIIRNTYPELKSTTIKTFQEWIPEEVCPIKWDAPITGSLKMPHPDGRTKIDAEFVFLALDKPKDVKKLLSFEVTAIWINEARELPYVVVTTARARCGRYPAKMTAPLTQAGVIMDTNPPDNDHWWYKLAEEGRIDDHSPPVDPADMLFFRQPGALILAPNGNYLPNPAAENVDNQQLGYRYWLNQISGSRTEWIKVYVLGQYGYVQDGKPVYPEYRDETHCPNPVPLQATPGLPLLLGWDFGLTPACVVCQMTPRGQFRVLYEFCADGMGIRQFANEVVKPQMAVLFPAWNIATDTMSVGDPAGVAASDTDEATCFDELVKAGFYAVPARTNDFLPRREAVAKFMTTMVDGAPAFVISTAAKTLRKGLCGSYNYRRMAVPGKEIYREVPDKDIYSHPQDALQYIALQVQGGYMTTMKQISEDVAQAAATRAAEPVGMIA